MLLSTLILGFIGMVFGTMIGMNIGGNYFTSFTFLGLRGYEATGQIGMVIGGMLFGVIGFLIPFLIFKQQRQKLD